MIKRIGLLIIPVIVLVSLGWFKVVKAQDLDDLSQVQRERLKQQWQQHQNHGDDEIWRTPQIFDDSSNRIRSQERTRDNRSVADWRSRQERDRDDSLPLDSLPSDSLQPFDGLRPFGAEFFEVEIRGEPPVDIGASDDYVLGPGDDIVIYLWGRVEKQYQLTLDRQGKVVVPTVGEIAASGLTLKEFTNQAMHRFGKAYSDFELTCSLGRVRPIRIYVAGEVRHPGAYTVSSLTSLFNALVEAGGPNDRGSMRSIKLMRRGKCVAEADLYRLLLAGDNSTDVRLQGGDVIFVPVVGPQVAIRGEIKRDAIYELKGEQTASELLELAGGSTAQAYLDRVMLDRVSGLDHWEVLDLDLNPDDSMGDHSLTLRDGDRLTVYSIFEAKCNMVALFGRVKHPGYYERNDTTRISDLLRQAQLPDFNVYYERADLFRRHPDWRIEVIPVDLSAVLAGDTTADLTVADRDSLHVYSVEQIDNKRRVYIEGAVKKPGWYPLYDGMSVADLIFLAGSYAPAADRSQAELARIDNEDEVELVYVPLEDETARTIALTEDDHVFVRRQPDFKQEHTVKVEGRIRYPGEYVLRSNRETLYQILERAGGFTDDAFPDGLVLRRRSIESSLKRLGVGNLLDRSRGLVADSLGNVEARQQFDYDLGSMSRIIINMDRILATHGSEGDVVLKPGDEVFVPSIPTGISVMGAVGSNGTLGYVPNCRVKDYIRRAGGFTRQADKDETRLIRADGEVLSDGALGERALLGDIVVVPTRIEQKRDWGKTLTTALSMATGVLTSVYIVSKL